MISRRAVTLLVLLPLISIAAFAQSQSSKATTSDPFIDDENGAVVIYGGGGMSMGLPNVQAFVATPYGSAASDPKSILSSASFGVGVRLGTHFEPFFNMATYHTGDASASLGLLTSSASSRTLSFDGGLRFEAGPSDSRPYRPYAEFGAGAITQQLNGTFNFYGRNYPVSDSGKAANLMYGVGTRIFWGHSRFGSDLAVDGIHITGSSVSVKDFAVIRVGIFFQSKRADQ